MAGPSLLSLTTSVSSIRTQDAILSDFEKYLQYSSSSLEVTDTDIRVFHNTLSEMTGASPSWTQFFCKDGLVNVPNVICVPSPVKVLVAAHPMPRYRLGKLSVT